MIESIKIAIKSDIKIKTTHIKHKEYYYISIANEYMANRLKHIGMHANKSLDIQYPKELPDCLFGSFLRGVIDGDGSVLLSKKRKSQKVEDCRVSFVTASVMYGG